MKITETKAVKTDVIIDIICDSCGKSCKGENGGVNAMKLEYYGDFFSSKDLEHWQADLCEACIDSKLSFIKFQISNYLP
jgi:hypothetical protein